MGLIKDIWHEYYKWLLYHVRVSENRKFMQYSSLFKYLHNKRFRYTIFMDKNREADGLYLRDEFFGDLNIRNGEMEQGACVLEVLVALACRMDDDYVGDPGVEEPDELFMELLFNLGFKDFTNNKWGIYKDLADEIIDKWLDREFDQCGNGSIFPIKKPHRDQREIEIWAQMSEYIYENY